jgi:hypothetical protein
MPDERERGDRSKEHENRPCHEKQEVAARYGSQGSNWSGPTIPSRVAHACPKADRPVVRG